MKLEVGKYYRTRDGRKVGPLEYVGRGLMGVGGRAQYYTRESEVCKEEGRTRSWGKTHSDIIAEWNDTPEVGASDQATIVDEKKRQAINEEYGFGNGKFRELSDNELIARVQQATTSPVQLRKVIVPGVYGKVEVSDDDSYNGGTGIYINSMFSRADLISARDVFNALIDALEE